MCGIICIVDLLRKDGLIALCPIIRSLLEKRGPNKYGELHENHILFCGCVLWQQGGKIVQQPGISENYILLFNGDVFNCEKDHESSDTTWLLNELELCSNENGIFKLLRFIKGPFSLIFYNRIKKILYFARDALGRNSLLIDNSENYLKILSCSPVPSEKSTCIELPPVGLYKIDLNNFTEIQLYPWMNNYDESIIHTLRNIFQLEINVQSYIINPDWLVQKRPQIFFDFYDEIQNCDQSNVFSSLLACEKINTTVEKLLDILNKSIESRIKCTPMYCSLCLKAITQDCKTLVAEETICNHSKIGILFSGGLDCSILAVLAHKYCNLTDSIDLINVSFESYSTKKDNINWNVPDRCSAQESYLEIQKLFPERKWNLVEVNVTRDELQSELSTNLKNLIYPLETVLDESLGCVFWFAARGDGFINNIPYKSNCRVILMGIGADELFGGYTRHKNAYNRTKGSHVDKIEAVRKELEFDWQRLPYRNLGRDDRVVADHGKTARAPYIEEDVVNFVANLSVSQKCCFDLEQGVGDKLLLRLCGYKLGLRYSAALKKRAAQFGSRIANKNQNAKDISIYLSAVNLNN